MTLFHKIIQREIPADIVYEDEHLIAFRDIAPQAPVHVLFVPKATYATLNDVPLDAPEIVGRLAIAAAAGPREEGRAAPAEALPVDGGLVPATTSVPAAAPAAAIAAAAVAAGRLAALREQVLRDLRLVVVFLVIACGRGGGSADFAATAAAAVETEPIGEGALEIERAAVNAASKDASSPAFHES